MRHLLNTLYVTSPENRLNLDGGNVIVSRNSEVVARIPLHTLESIVCFSYSGATPMLMGACAEAGIDLSFFSPHGSFLARTVGEERGNVLLRMEQYRISDSVEASCTYARNMVLGKVYNARKVIERSRRDHSMRIPIEKAERISGQLLESLGKIRSCNDLDSLRGIEGESAQRYFDYFDDLLLQQKKEFAFKGRSRRPPMDRINALLSFVYSLLAGDSAAALQSVGLDPYVGFMHRPKPGRRSLALDLMEEFRPVMGDRFALTCVNQKMIQQDHFNIQESGAVFLNDEGRRIVLRAWQEKKQDQIRHPFLNEKVEWGLIPYVQALLLARTIRGDLEAYPPFFWK